MATQARIRANTKWDNKTYDKILLRIRKDGEVTKERIQQATDNTNQFILDSIRDRLQGYDIRDILDDQFSKFETYLKEKQTTIKEWILKHMEQE